MNVNGLNLFCKEEYSFKLANGQGWRIISNREVFPWVKKLASIMELNTCEPNGYPKLILLKRRSSKDQYGDPISRLDPNIVEDLPRRGWKAHNLRVLQLWTHPNVPDVICEIGHKKNHELDIIRMWLTLHPIYKRAQNSGGLPFHAALLEREGIGVLLAAPGGTGKSTCCRRLPLPWYALCDDETLVVRDDHTRYLAHPFPTWSDYLWRRSGRTWNVQRYLPIFAIFFLEKAETDEIVPMGLGEAAIFINQSATQVCQQSWRNLNREEERALRKELFNNACELAKVIPGYILRVSLTGRFWEKIEGALK